MGSIHFRELQQKVYNKSSNAHPIITAFQGLHWTSGLSLNKLECFFKANVQCLAKMIGFITNGDRHVISEKQGLIEKKQDDPQTKHVLKCDLFLVAC